MQIVDLTDVVQVTRGLVDIDSTTGREGDVVLWTATLLSQAGYEVVEQVVQGPRRNLYAAFGKADVVFSTHLDCVPPFFPSRLDGDTLHGRGSCDAKGAAASQIAALETLRREGITNVGLLLVVGEERGSDGAKTAHALASGSRYLVNGEPTDNRLGIGTRGILRVNLKASGRAGAFIVSGARRFCRGETARCPGGASKHPRARTRADGAHATTPWEC
jgi:acetylornithine deacetylase